MDEGKHTPGRLEVREVSGAGIQIWAEVNIGRDEHGGVLQPIYEIGLRPLLQVGEDGRVHMMLAYESWRQFPSTDFKAMQRANAVLFAAAPEMKDFVQRFVDAGDHVGFADRCEEFYEEAKVLLRKATLPASGGAS